MATAEAVFDALARRCRQARIAESSAGTSGTISHTVARRRYPQVQYELPAGAIGARADRDGVSASKAHVANGASLPSRSSRPSSRCELVRFELVRDSGGPGRFRGGLGYVREYRVLGDGQFSGRAGHLLTAPGGRAGGHSGSTGRTVVNPGTDKEHLVRSADGNVPLHAGDILRREMTGAGGYGDPLTRDVRRVLDDVRDGYVSPQAAEDCYGVVVVPRGQSWDIDEEATTSLRQSSTGGTS